MTNKMLQGLAIGIMVTTSIFAYGFYYTNSFTVINEVPVEIADFSKEDIEHYLRSNDLLAVKKNDYEELLSKVENRDGETKVESVEGQIEELINEENNESESTKELWFVIEPGTASSLIGLKLEEKGLIKDKVQFENFLIEGRLETQIKAGKFKLSSNMSLEEIIEEIT